MAIQDPTEEQYDRVYRATYDAVWAVVGEVVYALVLVAFFFIGLQVLLFSLTGPVSSLLTSGFALFGVALVVVAAYRFVKLFDLLPSL